MNIRNKILLLFFSTVIILASVLLFFRKIQEQQHALIIKSATEQLGVLINTAINLQSNQLDQLVSDYSNWDEMGYIQNPNQEWAKDNIGSIIKSFKLFNVSVYNQDLRLIYNYGNQPGGVLNDSITRTDIIKIILKKEQIHFFQATADGLQEI